MDALLPVAQSVPTRRLAVLTAVAIAAPAIGAVVLHGTIGAILAFLAILAVVVSGAAWRLRAIARSLPLEIAPQAARGTLDGRPAWWIRARLGVGRYVQHASADIEWRGDGRRVRLDRIEPSGPRVGAWTVIVVDRNGEVGDGGEFIVRLRADEPGRRWETERVVAAADVRSGRFATGPREWAAIREG